MGGYNTPVVISTAFLDDLAVFIEAKSTVRRTEDDHQQAKRRKAEDYEANSTPVKPRLWSDIHGNKVNIVLRGCTQAVLSTILRRPGITEVPILFEELSQKLTFHLTKFLLCRLQFMKSSRLFLVSLK
jgi:hypothetical protein